MKLFGSKTIPHEFARKKAIFIHVPKCAGTSVSINTFGYQIGHADYRHYANILGSDIQKYYTFAIIRHPLDRFISAFNFLKNNGMSQLDAKFREKHTKIFDNNDYVAMLDLIRLKKVKHLHFRPIVSYVSDKDQKIKCNYIHKIEDDINTLYDKLSVGVNEEFAATFCDSLDKMNMKNLNKREATEVTDDAIKLIKKIYHEDFWKFGYNNK